MQSPYCNFITDWLATDDINNFSRYKLEELNEDW